VDLGRGTAKPDDGETLVAALGAPTIAAHPTLGAAGVLTAVQWQSGALIGMVVLLVVVPSADHSLTS
jgi:hypothetical protein